MLSGMNNTTDAHKIILGQVAVRLLEESERARFDELLEQEHYLKSARIGGRSLRYVAELNGQWIALLTFSGAAPNLKSREDLIGWSQTQKPAAWVLWSIIAVICF